MMNTYEGLLGVNELVELCEGLERDDKGFVNFEINEIQSIALYESLTSVVCITKFLKKEFIRKPHEIHDLKINEATYHLQNGVRVKTTIRNMDSDEIRKYMKLKNDKRNKS